MAAGLRFAVKRTAVNRTLIMVMIRRARCSALSSERAMARRARDSSWIQALQRVRQSNGDW
jgi:hypothetical protein